MPKQQVSTVLTVTQHGNDIGWMLKMLLETAFSDAGITGFHFENVCMVRGSAGEPIRKMADECLKEAGLSTTSDSHARWIAEADFDRKAKFLVCADKLTLSEVELLYRKSKIILVNPPHGIVAPTTDDRENWEAIAHCLSGAAQSLVSGIRI